MFLKHERQLCLIKYLLPKFCICNLQKKTKRIPPDCCTSARRDCWVQNISQDVCKRIEHGHRKNAMRACAEAFENSSHRKHTQTHIYINTGRETAKESRYAEYLGLLCQLSHSGRGCLTQRKKSERESESKWELSGKEQDLSDSLVLQRTPSQVRECC